VAAPARPCAPSTLAARRLRFPGHHGMEEVMGSSPPKLHPLLTPGQDRISSLSFQRSVWFSTRRGGQSGGSLALWCALKMSSIAFAPRLSTGRNSLRYTFSVVRVFAWPTRFAMSSIGIPRSTAARRNCAAVRGCPVLRTGLPPGRSSMALRQPGSGAQQLPHPGCLAGEVVALRHIGG
jgi:hypothetical protein